jgi:multisubunit Na+/H+ antiporter MnhB subunit
VYWEPVTGSEERKTGDNCVMFLDEPLTTSSDRTDLFGLRISAGLLAALGCLFALYALLFGFVLFPFWQRRTQALDKRDLFFFLLSFAIAAALTYLCFRAAAALRNARRWAAYVAIGFGLLLLFFSADIVHDWFHPDPHQLPDEGYVIVLVPFCVTIGLWWCIYLNLPRVRAYLE